MDSERESKSGAKGLLRERETRQRERERAER